MDRILLGRESLSKRWDVSIQTIIKYEQDGIIARISSIPSPRYHIEEIERIEGYETNPLSPLERKRLENRIELLEKENARLKETIKQIKGILYL